MCDLLGVEVATSSTILSGRVRAVVEANSNHHAMGGRRLKTATTTLIATMAESPLLTILADVVRVPKNIAHPRDAWDLLRRHLVGKPTRPLRTL
jgi:hypothetical protein